MTNATAPRVIVGAYHDATGKPHALDLILTADADALAALLAMFPKSCKVRRPRTWITLTPNAATGTRNESGELRARRILDTLAASGVAFEWNTRASNAYQTPADFLAALN